ncbi:MULTISPECIES: TetR/AcrR family transcriptional regulator [Paraburkholderia]|uniref:TetR/AcrR family transcriptional regulator n=1 Tax=Paraburkholderia TaxID=1822464 RepID=UPI0022512985|nr:MULTISPECIES: TetR/AcrR family transcriptional regulator [Paraburkholderia]MCX4163617.1 TetR/AcrR family transcriptional regulator [Paraburkholderia megapolitana]MDN7159112.1 TetR/AcrR family transcriptional regulator [Paraburkholderia sp. CHISQ3]MDQ6496159.1 TetR/AcrR family transcriptional regulator [Paraburkholderia megapolitana]
MRLTKEQAAQNRDEILEASTRLFKTQGIDNVSVADLMSAAGFSHGGFYNHFESKADLAVEVIRYAFGQSVNELEAKVTGNDEPSEAMTDALLGYLAPAHRDTPSGGCPTGSLAVDVSRQPCEAQAAFADGLEQYIDLISRFQSAIGPSSRQDAIGTLSTLVGAIVLSRAVKHGRPELSDEILQATSLGISRQQPVIAKKRRSRSA